MRGKFTVSKTNWIISFQFLERPFHFPRILCRSVPPSRWRILFVFIRDLVFSFFASKIHLSDQMLNFHQFSLQHAWLLVANIISQLSRHGASTVSHDQALISINTRIVHVRYIKILTWLRSFLVIFLFGFLWAQVSSGNCETMNY